MTIGQAGAPRRVAVIGAGFGGIAAAITLRRAGFTDIAVFEASDGIGGTWWQNRYPGAATDAASHIYSYSFAPLDWARTHMGWRDLQAYMEHVVDRFGLRASIRLGTPVRRVVWDRQREGWTLTTGAGETEFFHAVVSAVGMFAKPRWPRWPGLDRFSGPVVHSAQWPAALDLAGKRVAVVGTGSSAAQLVPALADKVAALTLFQRQPGWLLPKLDRGFRPWERALLKVGLLQRLYRLKLYLVQERRELNGRFFRPGAKANTAARDAALSYIASAFRDRPDLAAAVTPDYPFAGKRAVVSSDFYPALLKPNVTLVPRAVTSCTETGLVDASGAEHAVDAIVCCTGFEVTEYLSTVGVVGREGHALSAMWNGEPHAFLGIMAPGFPNFFMLYGPNTNGGFIITNLERQANFIARELARLRRRGLPSVEVTTEATERYNAWLQGRIAGTAFLQGENYFKTASGRVVTQWPDNATQYAWRLFATRRFSGWRRPVPRPAGAPASASAALPGAVDPSR